jgi:hypothetical protein
VVRLSAADPVPAPRETEVVTTTHDRSDETAEPITATRDFDNAPTPTPMRLTPQPARASDEDLTTPREKIGDEPVDNAFFAALPAGERDAALQRCSQRTLAAGDVAIRAGESSHPLWLVVTGRLEVRAGAIALDAVLPGSFIGEAALLARTPAPHAVVAAVDSVVLVVSPHVVFELAGAHPALWAQLKELAERRARLYAQRLSRAST